MAELMAELPPPMTPAGCDLRDFSFMPLDVALLRDSAFAKRANGDEFRAAVMLWCASWHQVPAGSLPDNDAELSALAGYGFGVREWRKVKAEALFKFEKCSDGRLYHPEISKKAKKSWNEKLLFRWRRECDRRRKHNERHEEKLSIPKFEEWTAYPAAFEDGTATSPAALMAAEGRGETEADENVASDNRHLSAGQRMFFHMENSLKGEGEVRDRESVFASPDRRSATTPNMDAEFETWWKSYPGRIGADGKPGKAGKPACRKLWPSAVKAVGYERLIAATAAYASRTDPKFVVDPERWLKREKWNDEVSSKAAPQAAWADNF